MCCVKRCGNRNYALCVLGNGEAQRLCVCSEPTLNFYVLFSPDKNMGANMVALLKDNGDFTPMPVVCDTAKFEQLKAELDKPAKATPALVDLIRRSRKSATAE